MLRGGLSIRIRVLILMVRIGGTLLLFMDWLWEAAAHPVLLRVVSSQHLVLGNEELVLISLLLFIRWNITTLVLKGLDVTVHLMLKVAMGCRREQLTFLLLIVVKPPILLCSVPTMMLVDYNKLPVR